MLASSIPTKFPIPFAADAGSGYIRPIPVASQQGITPGAASLTDGFPPSTFQPEGSGGIPPFGQDFNGILNQSTAWLQWVNAGAPIIYDGTFSSAIGGYPNGAFIYSASGGAWWLSTADNNTSDPDTGGANWQQIAYGQTYAGNPNGNVAGNAGTSISLTNSMLWDTTNKILWLCTTSGTASTAVWTQIASTSTGNFWCGTSTGTANAQSITPPTALQSMQAGIEVSWKVGATLKNTGATTITIGSLGTFNVYRDSPVGPIALTGGELVPGNTPSGRFDGSVIHLISLAQGTAVLANTSSNTGIVSAISGTTTVGHVAIFSDTAGTIEDGGTFPAFGGNVINSSQNISPGVWYVDTTSGAVTLTLSAVLTGAYTILDATNNWSVNNVTINGNGNNIGPTSTNTASTFIANVSDYQFYIEAQSTYWRLA